MDLHLEGVTSDLNVPLHFGPGAVYWDARYLSGYTNDGKIIGNWVGRRGRGEEGWATYWFSPRNSVQFGYRHNDVDKAFLDGGSYQDFSVRTDLMFHGNTGLSGSVQYEGWQFPVLKPGRRANVTATVQLSFWPNWRTKER